MTFNKIPMLDLHPEVEMLWDELQNAIARVLRSGTFIMGPEVEILEANIASYMGVKHAIALNSGTDALVIGLRAMGIQAGDEVITTPFSFFATAECISLLGAKPVFVDIDPISFNLDPHQLEAVLTPQTKAIIPVHLYGQPAAMGKILKFAAQHNLKVLEDCAQSFGAKYMGDCSSCTEECNPKLHRKFTGTMGHAGAYSFFPSKNLGAYGDGGMLITSDDALAETARMLRSHGSIKKYHNQMVGYNSRLDSLQAAILLVKFPQLEVWNQARREIAARYNAAFADHPHIVCPPLTDGHIFHQYTIRIKNHSRDTIQQQLEEQGISSMVYYPIPQDRLPVYAGQYPSYPHSEQATLEVLSLPMWPQMPLEVQERVIDVLKGVLS